MTAARYWLALLPLCLLVVLCGCQSAVEVERIRREKREAYEKYVADPHALMPEWFRKRYKPFEQVESLDANIFAPVRRHSMLLAINMLGLVLYPIWTFLLVAFGKTTDDTDEKKGQTLAILFSPVIFWIVNALLAGLLEGVLYLVLSVLHTDDVVVRWDFLSFCLHAVVHLTGVAFLALLAASAVWYTVSASAQAQKPVVPAPGKSRFQFAVRTMIKSFVVAVVSGLASHLGGWLGGIVVLAIGSGLAAYLGIKVPGSDEDRG